MAPARDQMEPIVSLPADFSDPDRFTSTTPPMLKITANSLERVNLSPLLLGNTAARIKVKSPEVEDKILTIATCVSESAS